MTTIGARLSRGAVEPDREAFARRAATDPVVPVTRRLLADAETPVGVYRKLAGGAGSFLLESAEHGQVWSRYSIVGVRCPATLTAEAGRTRWLGERPFPDLAVDPDPLAELRATMARLHTPRPPGAPPLTGGLVGYLGYDVVRRLERLPDRTVDDLRLPELAMMLVSDLAVLDHADGSVLLVANSIGGADPDLAYDDAVSRLDAMTVALARDTPASVSTVDEVRVEPLARSTEREYQEAVRRAKEEIYAGEAFQVVLSQRFELPTEADPLDVYRVLRATNPSPYMYLLRFPDGVAVVGSSPEAHVKVTGGRALMHPIAGSRPRGSTPEEDAALAAELLADPKERSEHVMLVDLARNDLGRVCRPGTVDVVDFMSIERFSHVMHLVSTVVGDLQPGRTAFDVLTATFPAGTLSGAPKPRAMQLIEELEPTRRGLYGGVVGYVDAGGDMDTAIAIRTALIRDGTAYVQAGAGVVADSDPAREHAECLAKARAVLQAVATAATVRPAR